MTGWSGWVAGWVLKRPRAVLGVLAAVTAAFALFLPQLRISSDLRSMVPPDDPVLQQLRQAADEFGSQDMVMVVVTAPNVFDVPLLQRAWRLAAQLEQVPRVERVISPFNVQLAMGSQEGLEVQPAAESVPATPAEVARWHARLARSPLASSLVAPEGQALAILVQLERGVGFEDAFAQEVAPALQALAAEFQGQGQEQGQRSERVLIVGEPYLGYSITRSVRRDMVVLFPLAVAVVLASLYATFRSLAALVLPMVPVLLSLTWTLGLMAALGAQLTIVSAAMPVMLVVVGSASAIHILNRYRELRWLGLGHAHAVERAMATLAGALVMVSLTDAAGFASLGTSFVQPVREFGLFTAAAILFSLLASLLAVPAVLRLREPAGLVAAAGGESGSAGAAGRAGEHLARLLQRPQGLVVVAASVAAAAGLALGIPRVRVEANLLEYFGERTPIVQATRQVERLFGGTSLLSVIVDTGRPDGAKEPELLRRVERLQRELESLPEVADTQSLADVLRQVNRALNGDDPTQERIPDTAEAVAQELLLFSLQGGSGLDALVNYDFSRLRVTARVATLSTPRTRALVEQIEGLARQAFAGVPVTVSVVGVPRIVVRLQELFVPSQLRGMAVAFGVVAAIVVALMRSWRLGLAAMLPLLLTVAMQFGLMGYSGIPLDIATAMIAGITIGVGVDYGIHLLSRFQQELQQQADAGQALAATLRSTGQAIGVNALTLSAGFAVLTFSDFRAVAVLGELLALTMLVSAAATLLPLAAVVVRLRRPERAFAHRKVGDRA